MSCATNNVIYSSAINASDGCTFLLNKNGCTASICVPNLCTGLTGSELGGCLLVKNLPATLNKLYSSAYMGYKSVPNLIEDIPTMVQNEFSGWFNRLVVIETLPYLITITVLIIVMMISGSISILAGILIIIMLIVVTIFTVLYLGEDASDVIYGLESSIRKQITTNWDKYGDQTLCNMGSAYLCDNSPGVSCNPDPPTTADILAFNKSLNNKPCFVPK